VTSVRRLAWGALAVALGACARLPAEPAAGAPAAQVVAATPVADDGRRQADAVVVESKPAGSREANDRDPHPAEPTYDSELPADQFERGVTTLRLRLRSDIDGEPVEMKVRLWRLGVPEDATWTAGDEVCATLVVPTGGAAVDRLPPGRYRLECRDRRSPSHDPPEFTLEKDGGERVIEVPNRPWFRVRLLLADETGARIESSVSRRGGSASGFHTSQGNAAPGWATPRRSKSADWASFSSSGPGGLAAGDGVGERTGTPVHATPDRCFDLGRRQEDRTGEYHRWTHWFHTENRNDVIVSVWKDPINEDATFVGVAAPRDVLLAHVVGPDGTRLDPATAKIELLCRAVRHEWTPPADAWRTVPVHVKIVKPGCEPLEFDWTAATADAPHALVASPPKSSK